MLCVLHWLGPVGVAAAVAIVGCWPLLIEFVEAQPCMTATVDEWRRKKSVALSTGLQTGGLGWFCLLNMSKRDRGTAQNTVASQ